MVHGKECHRIGFRSIQKSRILQYQIMPSSGEPALSGSENLQLNTNPTWVLVNECWSASETCSHRHTKPVVGRLICFTAILQSVIITLSSPHSCDDPAFERCLQARQCPACLRAANLPSCGSGPRGPQEHRYRRGERSTGWHRVTCSRAAPKIRTALGTNRHCNRAAVKKQPAELRTRGKLCLNIVETLLEVKQQYGMRKQCRNCEHWMTETAKHSSCKTPQRQKYPSGLLRNGQRLS